MAKARAIPGQIAFVFDPPAPAILPAALAGEAARTAQLVGEALASDPRPRHIIAAEMSALLDEDVSKAMLDAYSSPARDGHNISYTRMKALIAVTGRFDLLDRDLRTIGATVLVGAEIHTARLGHLRARYNQIKEELREAERAVTPIVRNPGDSE